MSANKGLHLVGGEKGGMGKTLFAQCLVEYFLANKIMFRLYDADRSSPDVGLIYEQQKYQSILQGNWQNGHKGQNENGVKPNEEQSDYKPANQSSTAVATDWIFFSEDQEDVFLADRLFDEAERGLTLVNLPAQVESILNKWLLERGIGELAADENVDIYQWFVTDGSPESLELLKKSLSSYNNCMAHLVVANQGLNKNALSDVRQGLSDFEPQPLAILTMPELLLPKVEKDLLKEAHIRLSEAAARGNKELGLVSKQRVKNFLQTAQTEIEKLQLFTQETVLGDLVVKNG